MKQTLRVILLASLVLTMLTPIPGVLAAETSISYGRFTEDANGDGAPTSKSDIYGNIKKVQAKQSANGKLVVTVDYWGIPNSHYVTTIKWCYELDEYRHNAWLGDNLSFLCPITHMSDYVVYFEPSLAKKGSQLGMRKDYTGTSVKGVNKSQWIYTISSKAFVNNPIAGLQLSTYYSSTTMERVTTTCSGTYSISCNTASSSVFDVDEVLIEMSTVAVAQPIPAASKSSTSVGGGTSTAAAGAATVQDFFDRITGDYVRTSHKFQVTCINDAPRNGSVSGLRLFLVLSNMDGSVSSGTQYFPSHYTAAFASKIKTWSDTTTSLNYIELDFTSPNANTNPCGMTATYVPSLQSIGSDVKSAMFLVGGPTGFAVASRTIFSSFDIG